MQITVNGAPCQTRAATLAALLEELGHDQPVATALNEAFVPASARAERALSAGDRVEILSPRQGG